MISCDKCWADWASPEKEWHYHGCRSREFGVYGAETEVSRAVATVIAPFKSRVAALLKDIEFAGHENWCPCCGKELFHKPSCELAALLKECS